MKREDVITFIQLVDNSAQGDCWTDKEWVLTVADLLGGSPTGKMDFDRVVSWAAH